MIFYVLFFYKILEMKATKNNSLLIILKNELFYFIAKSIIANSKQNYTLKRLVMQGNLI